jgi:hypothetical protein
LKVEQWLHHQQGKEWVVALKILKFGLAFCKKAIPRSNAMWQPDVMVVLKVCGSVVDAPTPVWLLLLH